MPDRYTPIPLAERQVDQAFPLIQSIAADVSIDAWRTYARSMIARPADQAGIMTVQAFDYIHGLFAYRVEMSLKHKRVLLVDSVAVLELFSPKLAMAALLQVIDDMALTLDCGAIHTCVPGTERLEPASRRWMMDQFRDLGHRVDSLKLGKATPGAPGGRGPGPGGTPAGHEPLAGMARTPQRH